MLINKHSLRRQTGLGLIESLIALMVISIGLLGIAALQLSSLKQSSSAQWHTQAVWFSYEMTDRIVANKIAFASYEGIDTSSDFSMDCEASACTPDQLVTADAEDWKNLVSKLPNGRGVITSPGANTLTVSVMWEDGDETTNCTNGEPDTSGMTCYTVTTVTTP